MSGLVDYHARQLMWGMYEHVIEAARTLFDSAPEQSWRVQPMVLIETSATEYLRGVVETISRTMSMPSSDEVFNAIKADITFGMHTYKESYLWEVVDNG